MKLITLLLPQTYLDALDELVKEEKYLSRSAAVRVAVSKLLSEEFWSWRDR